MLVLLFAGTICLSLVWLGPRWGQPPTGLGQGARTVMALAALWEWSERTQVVRLPSLTPLPPGPFWASPTAPLLAGAVGWTLVGWAMRRRPCVPPTAPRVRRTMRVVQAVLLGYGVLAFLSCHSSGFTLFPGPAGAMVAADAKEAVLDATRGRLPVALALSCLLMASSWFAGLRARVPTEPGK